MFFIQEHIRDILYNWLLFDVIWRQITSKNC